LTFGLTLEQGIKMSGTDHNAPTGKSGRRNRKKEQRKQKADQQMSPQLDQVEESKAPIEAIVAPPDPAPIEATAPPDPAPPDAAPSVDADPIGANEPPDPVPVSFQTIANAYGDFTRKSLEETRSFVEKLSGTRSLDKAMEVQSEFARQAYKTFVAESQKIRELHSELAKQTLKPLERLVSKTSRDRD
jgi:phasin family protein